MKTRICILTLLSLMPSISVNGESMIGNLLKKWSSPSRDMSRSIPGVKKISTGRVFMYKLDNGIPSMPAEEVLRAHAAHQQSIIDRGKVNSLHESDESAAEEVRNGKKILYGSESSPIKDPAVMAAWDEATAARERLEAHRDYMEKVRKNRKTIAGKKTGTR